MCSQVWRKAGIAKECEDHAVEKMSMQWEVVDWADRKMRVCNKRKAARKRCLRCEDLEEQLNRIVLVTALRNGKNYNEKD